VEAEGRRVLGQLGLRRKTLPNNIIIKSERQTTYFLFFFSARDGAQDPVRGRQVLYHQAIAPTQQTVL
jgi:hypothetical protein